MEKDGETINGWKTMYNLPMEIFIFRLMLIKTCARKKIYWLCLACAYAMVAADVVHAKWNRKLFAKIGMNFYGRAINSQNSSNINNNRIRTIKRYNNPSQWPSQRMHIVIKWFQFKQKNMLFGWLLESIFSCMLLLISLVSNPIEKVLHGY